MKKSFLIMLIALILTGVGMSQFNTVESNHSAFTVARLQFSGGGDWYCGRSGISNLHKFLAENTNVAVVDEEVNIKAADPELYNYPFLYLTGHGNIKLTEQEVSALREYLISGGFLFANDSYSLAPAFKREMKRVFPEKELVELPFSHEIYHCLYEFPNGLPKIHEHDNKPPQGFGIFWDEELVVFFAYESDIGDGWEDYEVHKDPPEKHQASLKMGANIVTYAMTH
ncbi:MAG: DUF4159 domain-containing protein [candidate division Zixibacteria bacterium]|nr:DUF4159 domain-containing protein [candidate division Zixibacteria bacterium]